MFKGIHYFGTLQNEDYVTYDELISSINPSFDNSFKLLFSGIQNIGDMTGKKRLQNLLNEILYPEEKEWIVNIEYLPNELTHVDSKQKKDTIYFDICCKCETNKGETIIIYIEIQMYIEQDIHKRMFRYGSALYFQKSNKTIFIFFYTNIKKIIKLGIILLKLNLT